MLNVIWTQKIKLEYYNSFSVKLWDSFALNKYFGLIGTFITFLKFKHIQQNQQGVCNLIFITWVFE